MQSKMNVDQMLADSFKELALRMPIDKITIREITDGAGVIRPTFYNHFKDKFELLEWIIRTEILDPVIPLMGKFAKKILYTFINEQASEKKLAGKGLTTDLLAEYYAQSMAFVVIQWIKQDMSLTSGQMADIFRYVTTHSMDEVIAEMN